MLELHGSKLKANGTEVIGSQRWEPDNSRRRRRACGPERPPVMKAGAVLPDFISGDVYHPPLSSASFTARRDYIQTEGSLSLKFSVQVESLKKKKLKYQLFKK